MFALIKFITAIVLPPFNVLILCLIALMFRLFGCKKLSGISALLAVLLLYIFSISYTSKLLENPLVVEDKLTIQDYQQAQAIVLLGSGIRDSKELYGKLAVEPLGLERMRYAAYLQKQTQLPLLITGSAASGTPESVTMAKELSEFFNAPTKWLETKAKTTKENVLFTQHILNQEKINKIVLVTHQWHMPRAKLLFEQAGFEVLPASVGYGAVPDHYELHLMHFVPQAGALNKNTQLLKEWLGYWKEKFN